MPVNIPYEFSREKKCMHGMFSKKNFQ